jgi:hypothetical protein
MLKLTVTNSKQQQLNKELCGCLLSFSEKISKRAEMFLVGDSFTITSVTQAISLS